MGNFDIHPKASVYPQSQLSEQRTQDVLRGTSSAESSRRHQGLAQSYCSSKVSGEVHEITKRLAAADQQQLSKDCAKAAISTDRSNQIIPPTPLNFSTNAAIFWKTLCFLVRYCGLNGLILGRTEFSSVPLSLAYSRLSEVVI